MYTRFGDVKFEFPATAAVRSEHQGPHFLVPIISHLWPSCVIILAFLLTVMELVQLYNYGFRMPFNLVSQIYNMTKFQASFIS